jgi:hypothetical protein
LQSWEIVHQYKQKFKKPVQAVDRRALLEETIQQHFNFEEMAKRSLAAHSERSK